MVADNSQLRVDRDFKNPYTDQFVAGFERELAKNVGLSVNYVYKRGRHFGAWTDVGGTYTPVTYEDVEGVDASGQSTSPCSAATPIPTESIFLLTNPPEMFTPLQRGDHPAPEAHGGQLAGRRVARVLSRTTGRIGVEQPGPARIEPNSVARRFGQNPNDFVNTDGRLTYDRPVTAKLQFVYMLPAGFLVGLNYTYQQGRPWARTVQLPEELVNIPTQLLAEPIDGSRGASGPGTSSTCACRRSSSWASAPASRCWRTRSTCSTTTRYDGVGSRLGTSDSFGLRTDFVLPRRLMLGAKLRF